MGSDTTRREWDMGNLTSAMDIADALDAIDSARKKLGAK